MLLCIKHYCSETVSGLFYAMLTHWGRVTHICVSELTIIGSDNGLSPGWRQAIIWNNAGLLLIEPLGTNFSEISIEIQTFSFKKMHLNMSSAKWRPFCLGLNMLTYPKVCVLWWPQQLTITSYCIEYCSHWGKASIRVHWVLLIQPKQNKKIKACGVRNTYQESTCLSALGNNEMPGNTRFPIPEGQ